ncbi:MAG: LacI family DNA-binding transcriptional regulator [Lachnospiraceae bacterium]|nr:LacI family DNA-binding transcriptional regulator [Lachnospiraceae bacterium]
MRHKSGSVTIYDIAKEAGVSASTVSRVLNNKTTVKEETRELVLEILKKHSFTPNSAARGLVMQESRMIGVLIADLRTTHHTGGIYFIERELAANGYSCLIHNTTHNYSEMVRYIRELCRWKVEGVVLIGSIFANEEVSAAIAEYMPNTPVLICNGYLEGPNIYCILADEKGGVKEMVRLLREKGRKHPVLLINQISPSSTMKEEGFKEGMAAYYPGQEALAFYIGSADYEIREATRRLLEEKPETDALIYAEDEMAIIGLRELWDLSKKIPEDVAVAGINNSMFAQISVPRLTSLDNVLYSLSLSAAHNLLALLNGKEVSHKVVIPSQIVEREST